jgi:hypothetical protein
MLNLMGEYLSEDTEKSVEKKTIFEENSTLETRMF